MTKYCSIYCTHLYLRCTRFFKSIFGMHWGFFHEREYINDFGKWQLSVLILFPVDHCFLFEGLVGFSWSALLFFFLRRIVKTLIFSLTIVWKEMFWKKMGVHIPLLFSVHLFYMCQHCSSQTFSLWVFLLVPDSLKWNSIFQRNQRKWKLYKGTLNYACTIITHIYIRIIALYNLWFTMA